MEETMKTSSVKTIAVITLVVCAASLAFAGTKETEPTTMESVSVKTTGRVEGVVRDIDGKPVQNALIYIEGCKIGAMTNECGKFFLKNVPCGSCTLKVQKTGFELFQNVLTVQDGEKTSVNVGLKSQIS
jgi:hypothetical protein